MKPWERDHHWAMQFWPEIEAAIRSIAGKIVTVRLASEHEDQKQATDLVVTCEAGTIALRVRDVQKAKEDATFRSWRASGVETELAKIQSGWGRWFMYVVVDERRRADKVVRWRFYDLDIFRDQRMWEYGREIPNRDQETKFVAVTFKTMLPALVGSHDTDQMTLSL